MQMADPRRHRPRAHAAGGMTATSSERQDPLAAMTDDQTPLTEVRRQLCYAKRAMARRRASDVGAGGIAGSALTFRH